MTYNPILNRRAHLSKVYHPFHLNLQVSQYMNGSNAEWCVLAGRTQKDMPVPRCKSLTRAAQTAGTRPTKPGTWRTSNDNLRRSERELQKRPKVRPKAAAAEKLQDDRSRHRDHAHGINPRTSGGPLVIFDLHMLGSAYCPLRVLEIEA